MSHFSLLLIGDNVEKQLEPYCDLDLTEKEKIEDPISEFKLCILEDEVYIKFIEFCEKYPERKSDYSDPDEWVVDWYGYVYSNTYLGWGIYHNPNAK